MTKPQLYIELRFIFAALHKLDPEKMFIFTDQEIKNIYNVCQQCGNDKLTEKEWNGLAKQSKDAFDFLESFCDLLESKNHCCEDEIKSEPSINFKDANLQKLNEHSILKNGNFDGKLFKLHATIFVPRSKLLLEKPN